MLDQRKIIVLNITFNAWIIPRSNKKLKALIKLQRFCRKGSGNHAFSYMQRQGRRFNMFPPPVLYRQVANCITCHKLPIRIYNKMKRMHYCIDALRKNNASTMIDVMLPAAKRPLLYNNCYCNNKPFEVYKKNVNFPRGNRTKMDGIRYIMCELSNDELTFSTRLKLSNYMINRLN
tara:strand:- start:76 stop:603 length:528 start_codon:yes stop_codon:yes gene_type:complete